VFFRNLPFFIVESWKGLFRNGWMSLASIGVVAITLLLLGLFVLINLNVQNWTQAIKEEVEIAVYVEEEATEAEKNQLENSMKNNPDIKKVIYVSGEDAMDRLSQQWGGQADIVEGYDNPQDNPLLSSFEVQAEDPEEVPRLARELEGLTGVDEVIYGEGVVEDLFAFTNVLKLAVMGVMAAMAVTATFLISHTIRLTVMLRRKEITIMKYVGATNWFIRWPFVLEGINLGILGTVLPLAIIYFAYQEALVWVEENLYFLPPMVPLYDALHETGLLVVPLGVALGVMGSIFSLGKYLKV